jgi:phosphoenolpyruvate-protein phosphotransferase (PTS system enzyme I)
MTSFRIHGTGGSSGIATADALVVSEGESMPRERNISDDEIPGEMLRLQDALIATRKQIMEIRERVARETGDEDAAIFEVHLMLVDDHSFIEKILAGLHATRVNVEAVLESVVEAYVAVLSKAGDEYLRGRAADLHDVARRILHNLTGSGGLSLASLEDPVIVVAQDLTPSETVTIDHGKVLGFATDAGSPTSHAAIMARALGIPAVVALHDISRRVSTGDKLLMDGTSGLVIVNPTPEELAHYGALERLHGEIRARLDALKDQPGRTLDGRKIWLGANIESPDDCEAVLACGAEGVGLFRTEFLYLSRKDPPSEDEQSEAFGRVAASLAPAPVVIRTMDFGGDKFAGHLRLPTERNPFMGCRGIRYCLMTQPELFRAQLRAILRASSHGNVAILYPMISVADELVEANEALAKAKQELRNAGEPFDEEIEIGAMIEVPAAALGADLFAPHVSFVSLGTNDLVQYSFAADRTNERTAGLHQPAHPSILRLLQTVIERLRPTGTRVGVCGEMAGNPLLSPLLLGLGVDELSMTPRAIPIVKSVIRSLRLDAARSLAEEAMEAGSEKQVLALCRELIRQSNPEILDLIPA